MFVLSPLRKSVGKYTLPKPQQMNLLNVDPIIFFILVRITMQVWESDVHVRSFNKMNVFFFDKEVTPSRYVNKNIC